MKIDPKTITTIAKFFQVMTGDVSGVLDATVVAHVKEGIEYEKIFDNDGVSIDHLYKTYKEKVDDPIAMLDFIRTIEEMPETEKILYGYEYEGSRVTYLKFKTEEEPI